MVGPPSPVVQPDGGFLFIKYPLSGIWAYCSEYGGGMTKQTNDTPHTKKPQVEETGLGAFFFVWVKTIVFTAAIVLILKYMLKVPFTF